MKRSDVAKESYLSGQNEVLIERHQINEQVLDELFKILN
jgi:hypothetical protein